MATTKQKVMPRKLSREAFRALQNAVGNEWVTEDRALIEGYVTSTVDVGCSLRLLKRDPGLRAAAVVLPGSTEEVQEVVRIANRYGFPVTPYSNSQVNSASPGPGTVLISMRRMNKITVDEENMRITVEPFINYGKIHHEAAKRGLWLGGSGWHGAIAKPCSQFSTAGLWQSDLKMCGLTRNTVGMKVVMADGSLVRMGSSAVGGTGDVPFTERFPGPQLMGIMKDAVGGRGIITEMTLKLHPWVGGQLPEDRGRLSVEHYFENARDETFDRPTTPARHKIFWFEYPDMDSITEGVAKLAGSGIGVALNITGDFNAPMCAYTVEQAAERSNKYFYISGYMVLAGVSSERQLAYEEKVLRHIIDETGGKLWSSEYKPDRLNAVAPWSIEFVMNTETGLRCVRSGYIFSMLTPYAGFRQLADTVRMWGETYQKVGPMGEQRGEYLSKMGSWCCYGYVCDRGHQLESEVDYFPHRTSEKELSMFVSALGDSFLRFIKNGYPSCWMMDMGVPWVELIPEIGPDRYLLLRKYKDITDPKGVISPQRVVCSSEEFKARYVNPTKTAVKVIFNTRDEFGMPKLEVAPEGDRWKPTPTD